MVNKCPACGTRMLFKIESDYKDVTTHFRDWITSLELLGRSYSHVSKLKQIGAKYLAPFFERFPPIGLKTFQIRTLISELVDLGRSSKTIKHVLDVLHGFLGYLADLELLAVVPHMPKVKVVGREKAWITAEQQQEILEYIAQPYKLLIRVMYETGIRPSEARALQVRDLIEGGVFVRRAFGGDGQLKETKTGTAEIKPVSSVLFEALRQSARSCRCADDYLAPCSRTGLSKAWRKATELAGVRICLYQAVRHSRASQERKRLYGEYRTSVSAILGHAEADTTLKHYALPDENRAERNL